MTSQNAFLRFFRGQYVQPWDDIAATYMDNCQDFPHSFVKGADVRTKPELYAEGSEMLFFHQKRLFFLRVNVLFLASILFIYRKCNSLQSTLQLKLDLWLFFSLSWRTKKWYFIPISTGKLSTFKKSNYVL